VSDSTSRHLERYPEDDAYGALPPAEQQVENPLLMVHRRLRGRYPLAIALAILFAIPGAYVGWNLKKPKYLSTGIIRVAPTLQPILYHESPENEVPPMFDAFVEEKHSAKSIAANGDIIEVVTPNPLRVNDEPLVRRLVVQCCEEATEKKSLVTEASLRQELYRRKQG